MRKAERQQANTRVRLPCNAYVYSEVNLTPVFLAANLSATGRAFTVVNGSLHYILCVMHCQALSSDALLQADAQPTYAYRMLYAPSAACLQDSQSRESLDEHSQAAAKQGRGMTSGLGLETVPGRPEEPAFQMPISKASWNSITSWRSQWPCAKAEVDQCSI